jgi:hypothetical protein
MRTPSAIRTLIALHSLVFRCLNRKVSRAEREYEWISAVSSTFDGVTILVISSTQAGNLQRFGIRRLQVNMREPVSGIGQQHSDTRKPSWRNERVAQAYADATLAWDATSGSRQAPSFRSRSGAMADSFELAVGKRQWSPSTLRMPVLVIAPAGISGAVQGRPLVRALACFQPMTTSIGRAALLCRRFASRSRARPS